MSAETSLMPESAMTADQVAEPVKPLNAEEATVIVLDFLARLGRQGLTPKSATLKGDAFVVEVELKKGAATVQVGATSREITEYSITPRAEEAKPVPAAPVKMYLMMVGVFAAVYFITVLSLLKIPLAAVFAPLMGAGDLLLIAGVALIPITLIVWWRRRS